VEFGLHRFNIERLHCASALANITSCNQRLVAYVLTVRSYGRLVQLNVCVFTFPFPGFPLSCRGRHFRRRLCSSRDARKCIVVELT